MSTSQSSELVVVESSDTVYEHRALVVQRTTLRYQHSDGELGKAVERVAVKRADAAGALLFDPATDTVVLVRQFRYPVYASLPEAAQHGDEARKAWLLEIVAGLQEEGQSFEETVRREVREETGYETQGALQPIATIYATPGYSAERIAIFLARVDTEALRGKGGGEASEGEDTELVTLPFASALDMVAAGTITDAKTVIALQYLALHQHASFR